MHHISLSDLAAEAIKTKAWPFLEAQQILARLKQEKRPVDMPVIFETGYGPSGLPHIGTFGEVMRTSVVRYAFSLLSDHPTRLIVFSDDLDGLRKVPDNVPNKEMMAQYLNFPLTQVPDPFEEQSSFGAYNNAMLRRFLDSFDFDYEFYSASEQYKNGRFDQALRRVLACYDNIMDIMLPTLGEERRASYAPFLPICPTTGHVLQVPMIARDEQAATVSYIDQHGKTVTVPVTGGHCKLQWKVDWAMRWYALGVDYEMSGKDLIDSVKAGRKIIQHLGGKSPLGLSYEHFLDQDGQKISKSKGNGLTIDEWLRFGPPEALSLFMYQKPKTAKRLYFDVIPKTTDDYAAYVRNSRDQAAEQLLNNPAFIIHSGAVPNLGQAPSFSMILNLVVASDSANKEQLWGFLKRYDTTLAEDNEWLNRLLDHAIAYYQEFIKPHKNYAIPDDQSRAALQQLADELAKMSDDQCDAETLQQLMFDVGNAHGYAPIRQWFATFYQVLLGQSEGPRAGSFMALYGKENTLNLIQQRLG